MLYNTRTSWGVKLDNLSTGKNPSGIFYGYGAEHVDKEG